jgi:hypothetical protein
MMDEISPSGQNSFPITERSGPAKSTASSFHFRHPSFVKWLVRLSRFGLAALFLFTAGAKLWIVKTFAANVAELLTATGFNAGRWMWPVTIAVIATEIVTAILLLLRRSVRAGALLAAALLIGFSAYALYYRYGLGNAEGLECGCFGGIIASQLGVTTALRNLVLLVPTFIVFFAYRRRSQPTIMDVEDVRMTT